MFVRPNAGTFRSITAVRTVYDQGITLPNRFVMPGMQRMWCDNGTRLPCLADYYRERVEGGVGLIITESCAVDHPSATQNPLFCRITDATMEAWSRCFKAVNGAGGRMPRMNSRV